MSRLQLAKVWQQSKRLKIIVGNHANLLFRSDCLLCGSDIRTHYSKPSKAQPQSKLHGIDICGACFPKLKRNLVCCEYCAIPLEVALSQMDESLALCGACQTQPPLWQKVIASFVYEYPMDRFLVAMKYNGRVDLATCLARLMAQDLLISYHFSHSEKNTTSDVRPDCLIPVPLHPRRETLRGYNQATLLANELSKQLNIPLNSGLIKRTRHTPMQSALSKNQRAKNLTAAFMINNSVSIPKYVAVIDDVMTTGSTAKVISKALLNAGVERVDIWCCARAE